MKKLFEKKWILYLSLTLCLVLAFVPVITHYASAGTAVASVTIGDTTTEYDSLDAAVQAVANCTAEDKAVLKLLQSFDLGFSTQEISSGVFTFDLNGQVLSSDWPIIRVNGANVDFMDSRTGGTLKNRGSNYALTITKGTVTINSGTFLGNGASGSVSVGNDGKVIVNGGTIGGDGCHSGLRSEGGGTMIINGGICRGSQQGLYALNAVVIVNGGEFYGKSYYGLVVAGGSKLTIEDGIFSSEKGIGACADWSTSGTGSCVVEINGGNFSGEDCGMRFDANGTCIISGGIFNGATGLDIGRDVTLVGGFIYGSNYGVEASGKCTIAGGTISSENCGVTYSGNPGDFTIMAGTIYGGDTGVYFNGDTLTISGGTINSDNIGLRTYYSNKININGGVISGKTSGWKITDWSPTDWSVYRLNINENGIGATFSGGIDGYNTSLETLLGEGAAYWLNGEKVTLTEGQKVLTGGEVVIMSADGHQHSAETYTNNGEDHTFTCATCGKEITEAHSYDETTLLCPCGAVSADAVVLVSKNGVPISGYTTLHDAIQAVSTATADDRAVLMLLQNIDLGENSQYISGGVFTLDLNGKSLCSAYNIGVLEVGNALTITDSAEGGIITGAAFGVFVTGSLTVNGGTVSGETSGIMVSGDLIINGGVVTGKNGVSVAGGTANIAGGRITGTQYGVTTEEANVIISGGIISGEYCDIDSYDSSITLTRGEKGVGATFVGGITVEGITLEEILGEGAVYWQCGKPVILTEGQTEITGCDVTVMDINTYLGIKGDLDGDGDVDAEDLTILARYVAGIITEWP